MRLAIFSASSPARSRLVMVFEIAIRRRRSRAAGWRRAMTCGFMPDGSTFNGQQNILTKEQMAQLEIGDVLEDDSQSPLIYHPTKACVAA